MSGARVRVRAELLAQRKALGSARVGALSALVTQHFLQGCGIAPDQWRGLHVALYRPLPGELDLSELEARLEVYGARLCFPRILSPQARSMEMAYGAPTPGATDPSGAGTWPKSAFGIPEPPSAFPIAPPEELDVVFVPGVAFGLQGERLGMGAGFYDRYLPRAPRALKIALAFDFQLLPKLEQESWDQRVDWIWTERRQLQLRPWKPPVRNAFKQ
jgi:5-formyltetrahydrofolate cyclo-ligase